MALTFHKVTVITAYTAINKAPITAVYQSSNPVTFDVDTGSGILTIKVAGTVAATYATGTWIRADGDLASATG